MTIQRQLRGSGGGGKDAGGAAHVPVESPDSLRSRQFARIVDLISEGEIWGPKNGLRSLFLDNTPLQNSDGTFNFTGVTVDTRNGTQSQSYIAGFPAVEAETVVSVEVLRNTPVIRQITNSNVNKVRVTLTFPQITKQVATTGDLTGTFVGIAIDLQSNGGGYVEKVAQNISGKTTTRYQKAYEIALTGSPPWDIRVRRTSADSTSVAVNNKSFWGTYTEIIDTKFTYPNSALSALEIEARQFSNVPSRGYEYRGLLVKIPSNYNPETRVYTGVWDGTFTVAWTDNPAWCFYDLLTNTRYGLGEFVDEASVDKWGLFSIAQYCDELVPNGLGGTEPRYTCNLYLQTRAEAYRVIANMASIFRGMAYWSAGSITTVADRPSDTKAIYTAANVIGGKFSYQGSAGTTRHTVALVVWNDPTDAYRQKIEPVEDRVGIARYGIVTTEVIAFGCTSRGQAHRLGRWLLYTERLETEVVTFGTGLDGTLVAPGHVIETQDPARAGVRFGGRVSSATVGAVTIDRAVELLAGQDYELSVMLSDGTTESRAVTTLSGAETSVLSVSPDFSIAPEEQAIWVLASNDLATEKWIVVSTSEARKGIMDIVGLAHNPEKFAAVEQNLILEPTATTVLSSVPEGVTNLQMTESLFEAGPGIVVNRVTLSWSGTTSRYPVAYREAEGNWVTLPEMSSQTIDLDGLTPGSYEFVVRQLSSLGTPSLPNSLTRQVFGKTALPVDAEDFSVVASGGFGLARWLLSPDLDVRVGGRAVVRHSPLVVGATWNDGLILDEFDGNAVSGIVPLITGTYMLKFVDSSENFAEIAASFVATEGMVTGFITVGTITEDPTFTGVKTLVKLNGAHLELGPAMLWDSIAGNWDDVTEDFDDIGEQATEGSYEFSNYLDLATVLVRRFEADIEVLLIDNSRVFDSMAGDWDDVDGTWDGGDINDCDVTLYASMTSDNPAGSPTWGPWTEFMVADFLGRAAKFRLDFVAGSVNHNIQVHGLTVHAKIPA